MTTSPAGLITTLVLGAFALWPHNTLSAPEASDLTTTARVTVRGSEVREFDWAKSHARARIAYISSGPRSLRDRMIDNDLQTSFQFSESDNSPMVIVELAKTAELHRVSTVFKAEDAQLDVILLNDLPKNVSDLQFAKPNVSRVDLADERGMISADFAVTSTRYVVLRWKRIRRDDPFTVAEISAFSNDRPDWISDTDPHLVDNANAFTAGAPPTIGIISP
jgi:hypothetical protein